MLLQHIYLESMLLGQSFAFVFTFGAKGIIKL